jgi:hypothetical protein
VCTRWDSYDLFLADVGRKPSPKHSLDRIDVNGNYEPGNVRWATEQQQQRNRSTNRLITYGGTTRTLVEWAEAVGLPSKRIHARLAKGWTVERALSAPLRYQRGAAA